MPELAPDNSQNRPPVVVALAAQAVAGLLIFGLFTILRRIGIVSVDLPILLGGQGVLAAILSLRWGLARWWLPLQMVLPIAAGAALALELPSWTFLAAFVALAVVFWNASGDRVPLYLTNRTTWRALETLLPASSGARFLDIGAGLGGTLVHLARARPDMRIDGVESAPLPFAACWLRIKLSGLPNARVVYGDMWKIELGTYDTVYAFLSPEPMPRLFDKVQGEMRPGSVFISNSFDVPDEVPAEVREVDDTRRTRLLIWRF